MENITIEKVAFIVTTLVTIYYLIRCGVTILNECGNILIVIYDLLLAIVLIVSLRYSVYLNVNSTGLAWVMLAIHFLSFLINVKGLDSLGDENFSRPYWGYIQTEIYKSLIVIALILIGILCWSIIFVA